MICARCNKVRDGAGACPECGTKLQSLNAAKRRGWIAASAGVFMIVFMGAVWFWLDRAFAAQTISTADVSTAKFLGRIHLAFALVILAGLLGIVNGWLMARSGRRNRILIFTLVVVFGAAVFIAAGASA